LSACGGLRSTDKMHVLVAAPSLGRMSVTRALGELRRAPVKQVPLVIPDPETEGMELTGPPAALRSSPHHRHLTRRNVRPAGVAHLSAAWNILNLRHSATRQTTVLESAPDDEANNVQVHATILSR